MCQALRELMKEELMEERAAGRKEMEAEMKALKEEVARLRAELAKRQAQTSGGGEHMYNMGVSIALDKVAGTIPTKKKLMQEVDTLNAKLSESEDRIAALENMVMELSKTLNNK